MEVYRQRVVKEPKGPLQSSPQDRQITVIIRAVLWQYRLIALFFLGFATLGVAYLAIAKPQFESSLLLRLNPEKTQLVENDAEQVRDFQFESDIESQVHLLRSRKTALRVVEIVGEDALETAPGPISQAIGKVTGAVARLFNGPASAQQSLAANNEVASTLSRQKELADDVLGIVNVVRLGASDVIQITTRTESPELAAQIANAFTTAYLENVEAARLDAIDNANEKANAQLRSMREAVRRAEKAVEAFKLDRGIGTTYEERVLDEQIVQLSKEISSATTDLYTLEDTQTRNESVLRSGDLLTAPVVGIESPLMEDLRVKYVELNREISDLSFRYGKQHPIQLRLKAQLDDIEARLKQERQRILDEQRSRVEIARSKLAQLEREVTRKQIERQKLDSATAELRELEDEARALNSVYQEFRVRFEESNLEENLPPATAEIVEPAQVPLEPVAPSRGRVLVIMALFGAIAGTSLAGMRAAFTTRSITPDDIEPRLGLRHLASVPFVRKPQQAQRREAKLAAQERGGVRNLSQRLDDPSGLDGGGLGFDTDGVEDRVKLHRPDGGQSKPKKQPHAVQTDRLRSRVSVDAPSSTFTESLRVLESAWRYHRSAEEDGYERPRVIMFTSAFPGEGKSTITSNIAFLDAMRGKRVLLIDADTRNPRLTTCLLPSPVGEYGLTDYLSEPGLILEDCLLQDELIKPRSRFVPLHASRARAPDRFGVKGSLDFLAARTDPDTRDFEDHLSSPKLAQLMAEARGRYDIIYVDSPPLVPVVDARLLVDHVDGMVLLVEWWQTPLNLVRDALDQKNIPDEKILGVVLNKIDERFGLRQYGGRFKKYVGYGVS